MFQDSQQFSSWLFGRPSSLFMNLRGGFAHLHTNGFSLLNPIASRHTGLRAFSAIAHFLWNDVSIDIRSIDDVNKFKSKLKTFLVKRGYELSWVLILHFCDYVRIIWQ